MEYERYPTSVKGRETELLAKLSIWLLTIPSTIDRP
jgi:hypothetical protein